jgi:hypothetical protein
MLTTSGTKDVQFTAFHIITDATIKPNDQLLFFVDKTSDYITSKEIPT